MARKRMINPDFWVDERIGALSRDARLLFIGMWNFADDEGRMPASPARLKAEVFPYDEDLTPHEVGNLLNELASVGLIKCYVVDGRQLLWIPNFLKHQKINHPTTSTLPPYQEDSGSATVVLQESSGSTPSYVMVRHGTSDQSTSEEDDDARETTQAMFDSLSPGAISATQKKWLKDAIAHYGDEEVREVIVLAGAQERLREPAKWCAKVLTERAERRKAGVPVNESWEAREIREIEARGFTKYDPNEEFYMSEEFKAKLAAREAANG